MSVIHTPTPADTRPKGVASRITQQICTPQWLSRQGRTPHKNNDD